MATDKRKAQLRESQATYRTAHKARIAQLVAKFREVIAAGEELLAELEKYKG